MYYIHKDHQGNMETITNERGVVLQKLSFDPWGRRRNPNNWSYNTSGLASEIFDRGYTMHEHLDLFGIINMNGRLYDPWVGRMLSPDPYLQNPSNLQNYNRYTYALNNPLKYVDPSGYLHNIYKPQGWDTNDGSGSGMFNYFTSGLDNRYNFDSYNDAVNDAAGYGDQNGTYEYRNGTYYSGTREVSFSDVFSNFVEPNSLALPSNTDLSSITATEEGVSYFTIDPVPSPLQSSFAKEVNLHFGSFGGLASGGDGFANSKAALTIGGGLYGALSNATTPDGYWLGENGNYYNRSWGGNQYTGSRTGAFAASNAYKWAGRGVVAATVVIGGYQVYTGYQMDGGQFGYNAQMATANTVGGIAGGMAGAKAGAIVGGAIGVWFGGVGAAPGAVIGGFIGGVAGGFSGSYIGGSSVNYYYRR